MKDIIVQKFGGTSVADTDKIKNVAKAIIREKNLGHDVVVVVSAMGHTTDYLVKMAHEISENPSSREMDMLLSTGEGVSIALLAMALQETDDVVSGRIVQFHADLVIADGVADLLYRLFGQFRRRKVQRRNQSRIALCHFCLVLLL